jgi:hypothetical protein
MRVTALNPQYAEPNRYAFDQPKHLVYEGEQVLTPDWAATGSIALTTNDPNYPVRLIDESILVSIDDGGEIIVKQPEAVEQVRRVTVDGSKGKKYVVTITPHGRTCTCEGYMFRRHCRHLNLV